MDRDSKLQPWAHLEQVSPKKDTGFDHNLQCKVLVIVHMNVLVVPPEDEAISLA